jgi:hypothetical protein
MDRCRLTHIVMKYQPAGKSNIESLPVDCYVETGTGHVACYWKRDYYYYYYYYCDDDDDGGDDGDDNDEEDNHIDSRLIKGFLTYLLHGAESFLRS